MKRAPPPITRDVGRAVRVLQDGGLVALPTEPVYGLGADASNGRAVARIFTAKQRPPNHPLIVHLHRPAQLAQWASVIPRTAWQRAEAFWPGPLTLILKRAPGVLDAVTGGQNTVALRVPGHSLALRVLEQFGGGIAAPSANRHGRISPTTVEHVVSELGDAVDLLLDGGPCDVGIEATIVDVSSASVRILRPGAITAHDLQVVTGDALACGGDDDDGHDTRMRSPGAMTSHYAPQASVVLSTAEHAQRQAEAWRLQGAHVGVLAARQPEALHPSVCWLPLGETADQQAQQLYRRLRQADELGLDVLIAVPPPDEGVGHALRDRLQRAAGRGDETPLAGDASPPGGKR